MKPIEARNFLEELEVPSVKDLLKPIEQDIVDLVLQNYSTKDIALRLKLPESVVKTLVKRKDIKEAISWAKEELDELRLAKVKSWYDKVLDARIEEVENASETTRKDTLEVVKGLQDLLLQEKKLRKPEAEGNVYMNILQQVMV